MQELPREGIVAALSGGLDSCIVITLCVHAVEKDKVYAQSFDSPGFDKINRILMRLQGMSW